MTVTKSTDGMKACSKCRAVKALEHFHNDKRKKDGKCNKCKTCAIADAKASYERNANRIALEAKELRIKRAGDGTLLPTPGTKRCAHCGEEKDASSFYIDRGRRNDCLRAVCKPCQYEARIQDMKAKPSICESCQKPFTSKETFRRGWARFCSDHCVPWKGGLHPSKYGMQLWVGPRVGYVGPRIVEHRDVCAKVIGRALTRGETVLHIDNNIFNNEEANLFLCGSHGEFMRRFYGVLPWPSESNLRAWEQENAAAELVQIAEKAAQIEQPWTPPSARAVK